MSVESVFEAMPVEESSAQAEIPMKEMGDRVKKGDTNSRIEAFGEMLGDDDYGGKPEKHEQVKIEKDKTPIARDEPADKEDKETETKEPEEKPKEVQQPKPIQPEIPKDAKVKVKIDGLEQEVSIDELKNSYSGKQAISKRFTELDNERKSFAKEKTQVLADGQRMQEEIGVLKGGFEAAVNEFGKNGFTQKNPLTLIDNLLDKIGVDSYAYNRAVFEHNLPEYAKFFEMSDVERDAYFAKKENDFLRKKDQTFSERTKVAQAQTARQQQEYNLIKTSGLSVDDFNSHFEELQGLGSDDLSVERVLEFAKIKPIFDKAGDIVSRSTKAGDVALIQQVSRLLMEFPNTTEEEILENINGKVAAKNASKKLSGKENYSVDTKGVRAKTTDDDFSDEDLEMFKQIRRR